MRKMAEIVGLVTLREDFSRTTELKNRGLSLNRCVIKCSYLKCLCYFAKRIVYLDISIKVRL